MKFILPTTVTSVVLPRCTATGMVCVIIGKEVWARAGAARATANSAATGNRRLERMATIPLQQRRANGEHDSGSVNGGLSLRIAGNPGDATVFPARRVRFAPVTYSKDFRS